MYQIEKDVFVICAIFSILGVLIYNFRMYFLIQGYYYLSKEEKKKINIKKYAKAKRNALFLCSLILILGMFVFQYFDIYQYYMLIFAPIVITGMVIFFMKYYNSCKIKFDDNLISRDEK